MLGPTANGRLMGPGGIGSSASTVSHHRNLWPPAAIAASSSSASRSIEFQTNGEVTESLFAAGGYNTPPASSPFLPCSPLELVAKNFHSTGAAVTFSQANSSIFVQSQTDFINGTTAVAKKTETCIGRWEHGTLEPLQIQIKREPCQVSEVTTSNNFETNTAAALTAVVKIEAPSPKSAQAHCTSSSSFGAGVSSMDHIGITSTQNNNAAAATIPVGIAVARQRLQDSTVAPAAQLHQAKELNRFGIGIAASTATAAATGSAADLGCTTPSLSQNMFFAGTNSTMIPLSSEAVTMGVTNAAAAAAAAAVQNAVRTPPALWQYPASVPVESMLPMPPIPPVGFQLVRDPTTGQILFLPTTTTIANPTNLLDKIYISCVEPFQQTVVWPSYPQSTAAIQPPHLLLPQIPQQQLQPPPLAPLQVLSSDYLATASSTTLHQQQHTQTHHSTRYVALTSDNSNKRPSITGPNKPALTSAPAPCQPAIPMPIPSHTFIKIEDCSGSTTSSCNNSTQIFHEQEKTIQTATIATSPDIAPQLLFQQGNLIQIAPSAKATLLEPTMMSTSVATANPITPPPSTVSAAIAPSPHEPELPATNCLTPPPDQTLLTGDDMETAPSCVVPEVQDANIQTDTPVMSEDDNTIGTDDVPQQQDASTLTISTNSSDDAHFPESFTSHASIAPMMVTPSLSTSTSEMLCHSMINSSGDSAIEPDMSTHSSSVASLNLSSTSSTNCDPAETEVNDRVTNATAAIIQPILPQALTVNPNCGLRIPKQEILSPVEPSEPPAEPKIHSESYIPQQETPVDLSGLELLSRSIEVFQKKASMIKKEPISPQLPPEPAQLLPIPPLVPCEPIRRQSIHEPELPAPSTSPEVLPLSEPIVPLQQQLPPPLPAAAAPVPETFIQTDEPMVGLNLLCALAEQRFQEEGMFKKDSPTVILSPSDSPANNKLDSTESSPAQPMPSPEIPSRKRKHKHSKDSKKSSKRSRHDKEQRRERKRKHSSDANEEEDLGGELKESLTRIKAKLEKCSCKDADEKDHRCCRTNWPTANELFSVMESDMKERLVHITRQCEEKKRELEQMNTATVAKVKPLTAMVRIPDIGKSYFGGGFSGAAGLLNGSSLNAASATVAPAATLASPKLSTIPALSPNFSSSSNSTSFVELPKLSSESDSSKLEDADSSSIERLSFSKRKGGIPKKHDDIALTETIVAKKPKTLVGYILASKNRLVESNVKEAGHNKLSSPQHQHVHHQGPIAGGASKSPLAEAKLKKSPIHSSKFESTTSDDTSNYSDSSAKPQLKIKSPVFTFEDENSKPSDAAFSIFGGKPSIFDKVKTPSPGGSGALKMSPVQAIVAPIKHHHSKHKKSRSKERKRRSSEKKRIDLKCLLTSEHLGKDKTRVLTAMGGLFYAGCLSAVQPPDIYAVTLDGERGNRPHIMSREEVLRDAILEVAPKTVDEIIPGTRLCAYWSQQYRCLYPGVAAEPTSPDPEKRYINVEFDDGDSGKIALEDIRFLLSDYPIVEYDPNPLLSLGKRKRQPSVSEPGATAAGTTMAGVTTAPMATTSTTITTNCFAIVTERVDKRSHDDAYREERRRLKKIRKDKLRRLVANNAELSTHKHKKKSKCYDEYCKHRKHKKRRKHKKHHREHDIPSSPDAAAAGSMDDDISHEDSASQTAEPFSPASAEISAPDEKAEEGKEAFNPAVREDTLTEEEASSSVTESSGSYYQPKKTAEKLEKRQSTENNSKIAAFLPARQLWAWCGKGYRRSTGRVKKQFYKTIQRGKETISVGDSAVFLSTGRPDRPYIGHIESMWETSTNNMVVRVKWFYHPEETEGCPNLKYPGALFQSPHEDENDVQTISHKCEVLSLKGYTEKFGSDPKQYSAIYDNNDTYYLAGYYDPTVMTIKMQPDIEVLPGDEKWVKSD